MHDQKAEELKLLVVEDDYEDYLLTFGLLSEITSFSFEVDWADSYEKAIPLIQSNYHHVYLFDYRLGTQTGFDLLLESTRMGNDTPVILLTGVGDPETDSMVMRAGAADYLIKGKIDAWLLERAIRHSLERAKILESLRESEERYELAVRGANDGIWDWNLVSGNVYYSERWKSMVGRERIGNHIDDWFSLVHPDDSELLRTAINAHLQGLTRHFEVEHRIRGNDGTYRWMLSRGLAIFDAAGKAVRMAGSLTDTTARKLAEERLLHDALYDTLTGLPNRTLFTDRLSRAMHRMKRHKSYFFAVLFIDLDNFKIINDSMGHSAGDRLLMRVCERLQRCLRPGDTIARLGGDEFTILLEEIRDLSDATRVAERIQNELRVAFTLGEEEVFISASVGITTSATPYDQPEELIRDADIAMYRAKALGKARHVVFDSEMHARAVALLKLETDLRRAIERQEFRMHYQPVVSLETGKIVGFEALVRWQHPQRGLIAPAEFIPLAEETGLIVPLGRWILRETCNQLKSWQTNYASDPPLSMSVNISSKQFSTQDLIAQIDEILRETGVHVDGLALEITESVIMENADHATDVLFQLRARNIQLYLDDFGTGYSSLSYLHHFPITSLKIDRSFISRIGINGENSEIIRTISTLARDLHLGVIAEGVEKQHQLVQLQALQCNFGQGFLFSRPVNSFRATNLLEESDVV